MEQVPNDNDVVYSLQNEAKSRLLFITSIGGESKIKKDQKKWIFILMSTKQTTAGGTRNL